MPSKRLVTNNIPEYGLTATSENPEFPVEHILTKYPGEPYRALGNTATITGVCYGGMDMLHIMTNAEKIECEVVDPMLTSWGEGCGWGYGFVYGADLVTNGTFDTDTDWTKDTGWTISGGTANCDGTQTINSVLYQTIDIAEGDECLVVFDVVSCSAGRIRGNVYGSTGTWRSEAGTYYEAFTKVGTVARINIVAEPGFIGSVDNVKVYGSDLVTNGTFDADTNWTKGPGWTISGGTANCDGTQTANSIIYQTIDVAEGDECLVVFDIVSCSAGRLRGTVYGSTGTWRSEAGTYYEAFTKKGTVARINIVAEPGFIGSVDNVKVYKVTETGEWVNVAVDDTHTISDGSGSGKEISFSALPEHTMQFKLTMTAPVGEALEIGIAYGGWAVLSNAPQYGLIRTLESKGTTGELIDGSPYFNILQTRGVWSVSEMITRADAAAFEDAIENGDKSGAFVAIQMANALGSRGVKYGFVSGFTSTFSYPGWNTVNYTFTEVK
jgi:hypothetical protein